MDPTLLYETPFTDFETKGGEGFEHSDVVRMAEILRDKFC
jgi:type I restriction enzyme R subunit